MNTKLLLSVITIGAVSSVGVITTRAFFTDTEKSSGGKFTVGTLDLDVEGTKGSNVESIVVGNIGETGDMKGSRTWKVNNKGTLPGRFFIKLINVANYENGCNDPESKVDNTCGTPGLGEGDLGKVVVTKFSLNDVEKISSTLGTENQNAVGNVWNSLDPVIISAGKSIDVKMDWAIDQSQYGNEIQSDSSTFDVVFDLVQVVQ